MNLLSLRSVHCFRCMCACCGRESLYTINAKDHSTNSTASYCLQCYHSLSDIFLTEE